MIYGLNNRDEIKEMTARYEAMLNVLSDILKCGIWDIEELFDSENNIEVSDIIKYYVEELGSLPTWNDVYYEAMLNFAAEHDLEMDKDVSIFTNACLDTHIYAREGLDPEIVEEMENLFNMDCDELNV